MDHIEIACRKCKYQVTFSMFLSVQCIVNNTLGEYIFVRKYFQGTYFWELCLQNCKFYRRCFVNTNQKFNFTEDIFVIFFFFFFLSFLTQILTICRTAGEWGDYFFTFCLPFPPGGDWLPEIGNKGGDKIFFLEREGLD